MRIPESERPATIMGLKISHGNVNRVERIWAGKGEAALRLIFLETYYEYI
jgi:hypothetical protein